MASTSYAPTRNVEELEGGKIAPSPADSIYPPQPELTSGDNFVYPDEKPMRGWKAWGKRAQRVLKDKGVEDRGIIPRPEDVSQGGRRLEAGVGGSELRW